MNKIPTTARNAVKRRSLGRCERCGARGTDVHHRKSGRPRKHNVSNLVQLCRACHSWAHRAPASAFRHGWALQGTFAAENASDAFLAVLGRFWVRLDPAGEYRAGDVRFANLAQVQVAAEVMPLSGARFERLTEAMAAAVEPPDVGDPDTTEAEPLSGLVGPVGQVAFPRRFLLQGSETVEDFTARLTQELKPVHGVGQKIGPLNEPH